MKQKKLFFLPLILAVMTVTDAAAYNYYWVGRATNNNWHQVANWSDVSGGGAAYTTPPSINDNVIFDANSFAIRQGITIDGNANCDSMIFNLTAAVPVQTMAFAANTTLTLRGSMLLPDTMVFTPANNTHTILLNSTRAAETLRCNGIPIVAQFTVAGTAAWNVIGDLKVAGNNSNTGTFTYSNTRSTNTFAANVSCVRFTKPAGNRELKIDGNFAVTGASSSANAISFTNGKLWITGNFTKTDYNTITSYEFSGATLQVDGDIHGHLTVGTTNLIIGGSIYSSETWEYGSSTLAINYAGFNQNAVYGPNGGGATIGKSVFGGMSVGGTANITVADSITHQLYVAGNGGTITVGTPGNTGVVVGNGIQNFQESVTINIYGDVRGKGSTTAVDVQGGTVNVYGSVYGSVILSNTAYSCCNNPFANSGRCTVTGDIYAPSGGISATSSSSATSIINYSLTVGGNVTVRSLRASGFVTIDGQVKVTGDFYNHREMILNTPLQNLYLTGSFEHSGTATSVITLADTVDVGGNWTYTGGGAALTPATTPKMIRVGTGGFSARAGDEYNEVLFYSDGSHGTTMGKFRKITVEKGASSFCLATASIQTDTLIIRARKKAIFNSITTVNNFLQIKPYDCGGAIPVAGGTTGSGSTATNTGTIAMGAAGTADVSQTLLSRLIITGNPPYTAASSIDGGNNTGWDFSAMTSSTYYWITGGTNSWDSIANWSTDPTAARSYPGNACLPSPYDNVVFDEFSQLEDTTVITTASVAFCNDMTWRNLTTHPAFAGTQANPLEIHGSLTLHPNLRFIPTVAGTVTNQNYIWFCSDRPSETIRSNSATFGASQLHFFSKKLVGSLCRWTLLDSLTTDDAGKIRLGRGYLNTNGQNLHIGKFDDASVNFAEYVAPYIVWGAKGESGLNISNSTITLAYGWRYNNANHDTLAVDSTRNSLIKIANANWRNSNVAALGGQPLDFFGRTGDAYYNLEMTPVSRNVAPTADVLGIVSAPNIDYGTFNKVTITGTAANYVIMGFEQTDTLLLMQDLGSLYVMQRNMKINSYLANRAGCGVMSVLRAFNATEPTITMGTGATADISNMQIGGILSVVPSFNYGVNITGDAVPYSITDCALYKGTGWDASSVSTKNWYWIGGRGNYNNPAMWSSISGTQSQVGAITPCHPPRYPDNVIFDDGSLGSTSYTSVICYLDGDASADSMLFLGNAATTATKPVFRNAGTTARNLYLLGSLHLEPQMSFTTGGTLNLMSRRAAEDIQTHGINMGGTVSFTNSLADWDIDSINGSSWSFTGVDTAVYKVHYISATGINITQSGGLADMTESSANSLNLGTVSQSGGVLDLRNSATAVTASAINQTGGHLYMNGNGTRTLAVTNGLTTNGYLDLSGNSALSIGYLAGTSDTLEMRGMKTITVSGTGASTPVGNNHWNYTGVLQNADSAVITFTAANPIMTTAANQHFGDVNFTETAGASGSRTLNATNTTRFRNVSFRTTPHLGRIDIVNYGIYNYLLFDGSGTMTTIVADTLQFNNNYTWTYTFNAGALATASKINKKWYNSGSNCYPITLQSSTPGTYAYISVAKAAATVNDDPLDVDTLLFNFINVRDIAPVVTSEAGADGERATFRKGSQSVDNGHNRIYSNGLDRKGRYSYSWTMDPYTASQGFKGFEQDEIALHDYEFPYTLSAKYFLPNPYTTFEWRKGSAPSWTVVSTEDTLVIHDPSELADVSLTCTYYYATCTLSDTVRLRLAVPAYRWWYLSSPYSNGNPRTFDIAGAPLGSRTGSMIGYYNERTKKYDEPFTTATFAASSYFEPGRGLLVSLDTTVADFNPPTTYSFTDRVKGYGTGYNYDVSVPVYNTSHSNPALNQKAGKNLLGNPYSYQSISFDSICNNANNDTVIAKTMWIRGLNKTNMKMTFDTYNAATGIGTMNIDTIALNGNIPVLQAFWVYAPKDGTVEIMTYMWSNNDQPLRTPPASAETQNAAFLQENAASLQNRIARIKVSAGSISDETVLAFNPSASAAYDKYDSEKMSNGEEDIPELYTKIGNKELVINSMQPLTGTQSIPLGFRTGKNGAFRIGGVFENFDGIQVILRDNQTGAETNLTAGGAYSFTSNVYDNTARFSLKISGDMTGVNSSTNDELRVSIENGKLKIENANIGDKVQIYNTVGQKLHEEKLNSQFSILNFQFPAGAYLVKVGEKTEKVVVK